VVHRLRVHPLERHTHIPKQKLNECNAVNKAKDALIIVLFGGLSLDAPLEIKSEVRSES
jgi:hypothetical protein